MIDELREEEIVNKVGGRFKLSTLIQKRLVALNAGARPLVDLPTDNKMEIVIQEIMQDKIYLDAPSNLRITGEPDASSRRPAGAGSCQPVIMTGREISLASPAASPLTRPRRSPASLCRPARA